MRCLTPTGCSVYGYKADENAVRATKVAVDPETGVIYATYERQHEGVEISVVRLETLEDGTTVSEVSLSDGELCDLSKNIC